MVANCDDELEILVIEIKVGQKKIRIINAYGPQEDDETHEIISFWQAIETEVEHAKANGCMVLIQLDANAKVGKEVIQEDPNSTTNNGRILLDVIDRQDLILVNSSKFCVGTITRERVFEDKIERSIIDYVITCSELFESVQKMEVDDKRMYTLSRPARKKDKSSVVKSDHNIIRCEFGLYANRKEATIRNEFFNFKCDEGKELFFENTNSTTKFSSCFKEKLPFEASCSSLLRKMKKTFQMCFNKVRVKSGNRKPLGDPIVQENLKTIENLKVYLAAKPGEMNETLAKRKLEEIESKINLESSKKNADIVRDHVSNIKSLEGSFCNLGFWKLKKKLWPEAPDPPMAKKDVHGNLLTSPDGIKNLYLQTYSKRLENRQMDPKFLDMYFLKMELWDIRSNNLRYSSSTPWTFKDLEQSIKKLKKNKARDPLGMTNEIFNR